MDLLEGLNEAQREAVVTTEGYVRVIAGAGSGKTRALVRRFAYLVTELGILPGNILCVTFTNKAANEMRRRIHNLTGDQDTGFINTFHGFCVSVLQEDSHAVQYPKAFLVLDNSDINDMLKIIYEERNLTLREMTFAKARDMIEMQKTVQNPGYYLELIEMSAEALHEKYMKAVHPKDIIFYGYLYQQKKCFGLDYNDLILFTLYIFDQSEEIKLKWQTRLEYIMIDEFQDIDPLQYRLMEVLSGLHRNLFIVGDPDQTIYTWRGANVRYLLDFDTRFVPTSTIMMNTNYRSTPEILHAVNALIDRNKVRMKKELVPVLESGPVPVAHMADTSEKEAEWIVGEMKVLQERGVPLRDQTVLYRAHYVTRAVEDALIKAEIPYTIYSGAQFYDRVEIKDALSYLRMIVYRDDLSFRRVVNVPKRNIGMRRMKALEEYSALHGVSLWQALLHCAGQELFLSTGARKFIDLVEYFGQIYRNKPISDVLTELLDQSGYEMALRTEGAQERLDNLAELKQSIFEFETGCGEEVFLEDYLTHAALFTNLDTAECGDKVKLMTVHAAKGLEFPYVFLCGMSEGIFPSRKIETEAGMEEERRLAFVAMTRAEKGLYLTTSAGRNFDGSPRFPSRFLIDIGEKYLAYTEKPEEDLIAAAKEYTAVQSRFYRDRSDIFEEGTKVRHKVFGEGRIVSVDREKSAYSILFDNMPTARMISFRVNLERV